MKTQYLLILLALCAATMAEPPETSAIEEATPSADAAVYAAILDFEADLPDSEDLGSQIADILTARLSIADSPRLVERARLGEILAEQELTLTGLVSQQEAVQVGQLTGARLLIMGRVFKMDNKLMIMTKIVGVETSRVKGLLFEVELDQPLSGALAALSEDIANLIQADAAELLPEDVTLPDPVTEAREALENRVIPTVAVVIPEQHHSRVVLDPAVETEIKKVLIEAGVTVVDVGENDLADWARGRMAGQTPAWPDALADADYVIVGEGFSELGATVEDLFSVVGRAEINMIDRQTGEIVLADSEAQRAVDLAEVSAGKTALQKAGYRLGVRVLEHLVETLPEAPSSDLPDDQYPKEE